MIGTRGARALVLVAAAAAALTGPAAAAAPSGPAAVEGCLVERFGYTVDTMCDSVTMQLDHTGDGVVDEYFDVRTDRVVVHAWRGSGGWRQLANGRADRTYNVHFDPATGYRRVDVWVNGSGVWCTSYLPGRDWYDFWKC